METREFFLLTSAPFMAISRKRAVSRDGDRLDGAIALIPELNLEDLTQNSQAATSLPGLYRRVTSLAYDLSAGTSLASTSSRRCGWRAGRAVVCTCGSRMRASL